MEELSLGTACGQLDSLGPPAAGLEVPWTACPAEGLSPCLGEPGSVSSL